MGPAASPELALRYEPSPLHFFGQILHGDPETPIPVVNQTGLYTIVEHPETMKKGQTLKVRIKQIRHGNAVGIGPKTGHNVTILGKWENTIGDLLLFESKVTGNNGAVEFDIPANIDCSEILLTIWDFIHTPYVESIRLTE